MSKITNSCVEQAVIVIISVVSVKCEQLHKSSENNKEFDWDKIQIGFTWFAINKLIYKRF